MKTIKKKLLIFDVDGTIWDSEPDIFLSFNHTLREFAGMEIGMEEFKKLAGLSLNHMFELVLPEPKKNMSRELEKQYKSYYIDQGHFADATVLYPSVKETLELLRKTGYSMAVASSKPKRILDKMVDHFDLKVFDLVLGTEESKFKHKPDPEILHHIMDQMGVGKERTVIIGDTKADILAGKNAGIDTIAATYGFDKKENLVALNPTFLVDDFQTLRKVLEFSGQN